MKKKEILKEFNLARFIAIICMIAVHTEFAIYDYEDNIFATIFDYLGSPFAAPIFMFIMGANIVMSSKNDPKKLFTRGVSLLGTSYLFNIICHALPFFIIDYNLGVPSSVENPLHWIFAVDILSFAGLALIFFSLVRKYKLSDKVLIIIAVLSSILNMFLTKYLQIDFNTYPILGGITSLFYSSGITGYFSFLPWIIFPIAGYIFIEKLLTIKNRDNFYKYLGLSSTIIYLVMVFLSFTIFKDSPLIIYEEEYSYYKMNLFQGIGNIVFCLAWISILYFISKIIPKFLERHINRLSKNLTTIYLIQWFIINYFLVLPYNGSLKLGKKPYIITSILIIIISDILAYFNRKYKDWKLEVLENKLI